MLDMSDLVAKFWESSLLKAIYDKSPLDELLPDRPPPTRWRRLRWRTEHYALRVVRAWRVLRGRDWLND